MTYKQFVSLTLLEILSQFKLLAIRFRGAELMNVQAKNIANSMEAGATNVDPTHSPLSSLPP